MDREADQVPVLLRATAPGVLVTVRANDNRVLSAQSIDGGHRALKLADVLDHAPDAGEHSIKIARNRTRKARTARLSVRFASVSLRLREQWSHSFVADAPVTVVHVREIDPPAGGEPIEWVLYTTYPVTTLEDALSVVRTYALRWRIERMHYTTKTGAGCLHDSQLRSFGALAKWITLHVAVASRLQSILYRAREEPDTPADQEFSRDEIEATLLLRESHYGKSYPSGRTPSLGELVFFIAKLGGYMAARRARALRESKSSSALFFASRLPPTSSPHSEPETSHQVRKMEALCSAPRERGRGGIAVSRVPSAIGDARGEAFAEEMELHRVASDNERVVAGESGADPRESADKVREMQRQQCGDDRRPQQTRDLPRIARHWRGGAGGGAAAPGGKIAVAAMRSTIKPRRIFALSQDSIVSVRSLGRRS